MGLFRPYERPDTTEQHKPGDGEGAKTDRSRLVLTKQQPSTVRRKAVPVAAQPAAPEAAPTRDQSGRKTGPTITRKQAEAERMERIHPTLTKREAKKRDRAAAAERRGDAWDRAERSSERVLARNYVDSRWTTTEFMLPIILVLMAVTMATSGIAIATAYTAFVLWGFLAIWIINMVVLWRGFKKELAERLPHSSPKGLMMYVINRAMMIRRFRRPGPVINRGDDY